MTLTIASVFSGKCTPKRQARGCINTPASHISRQPRGSRSVEMLKSIPRNRVAGREDPGSREDEEGAEGLLELLGAARPGLEQDESLGCHQFCGSCVPRSGLSGRRDRWSHQSWLSTCA